MHPFGTGIVLGIGMAIAGIASGMGIGKLLEFLAAKIHDQFDPRYFQTKTKEKNQENAE